MVSNALTQAHPDTRFHRRDAEDAERSRRDFRAPRSPRLCGQVFLWEFWNRFSSFLGDTIAITMTPNEASTVVVYMGTLTIEDQDPEGIYSMGFWWDPELWQSNEAILEVRVDQ